MPFPGSAPTGNRTPSTPSRITWVIAGASTLFLVASVLWWMSGSSPATEQATASPTTDTQATVIDIVETTTTTTTPTTNAASVTAPTTDPATAATAATAASNASDANGQPVTALESPDAATTPSAALTPATRGTSVNVDPVIVSAPATGETIGDKGPDSPAPQPARDPLATAPLAAPTVDLPTALSMVGTDPIAARLQLTRLIDSGTLSPEAKRQACDAITTVNAGLFFSSTVNPADAMMTTYTVKSGDALSKIAHKAGMAADWRMIMRLNGIKDANRIRVGQVLKVPTCTFHAVVNKSEYRLYLYAGEGADRVLVGTYPVGLGELNSTPTGAFMLKPGSRLVNPEWRNPRTGEYFKADDPKNPIGERWIGLQGVDAGNSKATSYGIHGTTDPTSIGKQASMGCVRLKDADVEVIFEALTEPNSTIVIVP
ncbi:MAG: LysM peptidoglycan-binding domain-containing protein [Phycisphaerae bacterium]|nr:LysM peptidoglycan-binding domain-containing protein [Phycisphaerae bacterium]